MRKGSTMFVCLFSILLVCVLMVNLYCIINISFLKNQNTIKKMEGRIDATSMLMDIYYEDEKKNYYEKDLGNNVVIGMNLKNNDATYTIYCLTNYSNYNCSIDYYNDEIKNIVKWSFKYE